MEANTSVDEGEMLCIGHHSGAPWCGQSEEGKGCEQAQWEVGISFRDNQEWDGTDD